MEKSYKPSLRGLCKQRKVAHVSDGMEGAEEEDGPADRLVEGDAVRVHRRMSR